MLAAFLFMVLLYSVLCTVIAICAAVIRVTAFVLRVPTCVLQARIDTRRKAGARELHPPSFFMGSCHDR